MLTALPRALVVSLVLGTIFIGGCAAARKAIPYPSASVEAMDLENVSLSSVTLRFDIEVKNPYGSALPVLGMNYELEASGSNFLEGRIDAQSSVPAGGSAIIPMSVKIPFSAVMKAVDTVRRGAVIPFEAKLGLEVSPPIIGTVELPLRKKGELRIP